MAVPQTHDEAVTAAHQLAEALIPGAIQRDRGGADVVPHEAVAALDASGLLGMTVPASDGGPGPGLRTLAEVTRIVAAADPAIAQIPQQLGARAQLVHTAIEVGIAGAALRDARAYPWEKARPSTEAVRHGASAATDDPHVRHRYGRLATRVRAAEALLESARVPLRKWVRSPPTRTPRRAAV